MLYSQGISLESLGIPQLSGNAEADPREVWRIFAKNYYLFRGTPTRSGSTTPSPNSSASKTASPGECRRVLRINREETGDARVPARAPSSTSFNIEVLSTTDTPLDTLEFHKAIKDSGWKGRVSPPSAPTPSSTPSTPASNENHREARRGHRRRRLQLEGYLNALRNRRAFFKSMGATATDHGHLTALTADLDANAAASLRPHLSGRSVPQDAGDSSRPRCSPRWPA
jgi:glucuronate isomerase